MKTSELINELVDSLKCFGDLPTNIKNISWYCPSENGSFEGVNLNSINDSDRLLDEEDEFIDIEELTSSPEHYIENAINDLIKNQKKIINKLKEEGK